MSDFRELLLGCGHSRVKKLPSVDGNPNWRNFHKLVTVDHNEHCDPDFVIDLDIGPQWSPRQIFRDPWQEFFDDDGYLRADFYDEVHAYEVLEHLGQQGDALAFFSHFAEIWRILKPEGHLYATVPSRFSPWLWGDPSHRRAILPESLVFLDQSEYTKQLDGVHKTAMSDFRDIYKADFRIVDMHDNRETFAFVLQAVKPSRR